MRQTFEDRPQFLRRFGEGLRQHARVRDRRHEVGVAGPPRHRVHVQVSRYARAGSLPDVDADVDGSEIRIRIS